jgi:signal transduction histidine kinase
MSLLVHRSVRSNVAMTGEITLRGLVLPVGGIKEKVLAAKRAGINTVILPERNRKDVEEIPKEIRRDMAFHYVRQMEEVPTTLLDMTAIVTAAQDRLADLIIACQGEIILPPVWPMAVGYAPWIEEVWVNYLSNALKYGGNPPQIELGFDVAKEAVDQFPNFQIRFWVRDNGPGLTPEEQGRLFTSFTRLDQVRAKGHGLGLSIVRRIVEKLGGQVGVESEVGWGSTFWFTLPGRDTDR